MRIYAQNEIAAKAAEAAKAATLAHAALVLANAARTDATNGVDRATIGIEDKAGQGFASWFAGEQKARAGKLDMHPNTVLRNAAAIATIAAATAEEIGPRASASIQGELNHAMSTVGSRAAYLAAAVKARDKARAALADWETAQTVWAEALAILAAQTEAAA